MVWKSQIVIRRKNIKNESFLARLFPDAAFIPLNVILGVVLTPAWFFAISRAYAS